MFSLLGTEQPLPYTKAQTLSGFVWCSLSLHKLLQWPHPDAPGGKNEWEFQRTKVNKKIIPRAARTIAKENDLV